METIEYDGKQLVLVYFTPKELEALVEYSNHNKRTVARVCRDSTLDILVTLGYLEAGK